MTLCVSTYSFYARCRRCRCYLHSELVLLAQAPYLCRQELTSFETDCLVDSYRFDVDAEQ